jgi:lipopolysaccharide transport system permease protein
MAVFFTFIIAIDRFPGFAIFALVPVLLIQLALAAGLGLLLATINVFYRDVQQALSIALQFAFWLTPIVYVPEMLSARIQSILSWNPMWPLILAYRKIFVQGQLPDPVALVYPALITIALIALGLFAYIRLQHDILDEV